MRPLYTSRAFAPAGAPAPAPAIPQVVMGSVADIIGLFVSFLITVLSTPRVWKIARLSVTNDDMLSMPLLRVHDHGLTARRYQNWLVAAVIHSLTTIVYTYKDHLLAEVSESIWILFLRCSGPFIVLIVSFVLLITLVLHYPITEVAGVTVGPMCVSYLLIVLTDMLYIKNTITLEIMLIPLTVWMHTLRFVSQSASIKFEVIALLVAVLGIVPGILCILTLITEFLAEDIRHIAFKTATLIGALFRLFDVFICCDPIREKTNYFRSRLQECFI